MRLPHAPRSTRLPRPLPAALTLAALGLAAACGSSGPNAAADNPVVTSPTAPATSAAAPTTATDSATTSVSASPSAPSDPLRCHTAALEATPGTGEGAAGTLFAVVKLTNVSGATCHILGYPGMQLLDAQKADLPTTVVRGGGMLPQVAPAEVVLAAGAVASFTLSYSDVPSGTPASTCPQASYADVTPPDETTSVLLTTTLAPCGGTVNVSPVVSGANGVSP